MFAVFCKCGRCGVLFETVGGVGAGALTLYGERVLACFRAGVGARASDRAGAVSRVRARAGAGAGAGAGADGYGGAGGRSVGVGGGGNVINTNEWADMVGQII